MAIMSNMGLHVFHPEWQTVPSGSMPRGRQYSTTFKTTTMRIFGGDEEITFPIQTCTRAGDVKDALCTALGVDPESVHFYIKQGCSIRKLRAGDEMATFVVTYRGFHGRRACREVDQALHLLKDDDVQMIVVGHTAGKTVRQMCGDRLVAADSSLSRFYRSYGNRFCPVQVVTERHGTCSRKLSPCAGQAARIHKGRVTLVSLENVNEEL